MSRALFPLLRPGARVVAVTSNCGHLSKISGREPEAAALRSRLSSPDLTEEELVGREGRGPVRCTVGLFTGIGFAKFFNTWDCVVGIRYET